MTVLERVKALFEQTLEVDVKETTNFFEAGGSSLKAAELLAGLARDMGVRVRLGEFFYDPTPAGLVKSLDKEVKGIAQGSSFT